MAVRYVGRWNLGIDSFKNRSKFSGNGNVGLWECNRSLCR